MKKLRPHLFRYAGTWRLAVVLVGSFCLLASTQQDPVPYTLKYPANFGSRFNIPADNPMTQEGVHLGRMLFYEPALSVNNTLSCASCHQQALAFTDGKAFSEGVDGTRTRRNAMSLSNLLWVRSYFWDGRADNLEAQAIVPLTDVHEMGQPLEAAAQKLQKKVIYSALFRQAFGSDQITPDRIVKALSQFERSLISADAPYDRYLRGEYKPTVQELVGITLFFMSPMTGMGARGANCTHCHGTPKTFLDVFHNNGLDTIAKDAGRFDFTSRAEDRGRFRVPTLRNIALTGPYMHDGRFRTLEDVLDHYSDHIQSSATLSPFITNEAGTGGSRGLQLTAQEKKALVAFLTMLTDSTFITNPAFADPHANH
ncbi:cytochrome-c peroxidase [Fulvivirgaceae bacterium PWU5]|uniref:Cytochrome-c peroxidase n=1 Tax=Dawidia cretensis TaxID=2782350 RepID=A0AAP2E027_9BACT|nr:cytochrome c peroxidase [Dawidia cretensis]MBT1710603.1 cytochrome-c peroxidase [Dawidia cretensis]